MLNRLQYDISAPTSAPHVFVALWTDSNNLYARHPTPTLSPALSPLSTPVVVAAAAAAAPPPADFPTPASDSDTKIVGKGTTPNTGRRVVPSTGPQRSAPSISPVPTSSSSLSLSLSFSQQAKRQQEAKDRRRQGGKDKPSNPLRALPKDIAKHAISLLKRR